MGVYDRQIESAQRIILEKGEVCEWHVAATAVVADAEEPWNQTVDDEADAVAHAPSIAFFPLSRQFSQLLRYLKGTEVVTGSLYGLMGAVDFTPKLTGIVERGDGTKLGITAIDPFSPNGEVIFYTIEFKQ
jgi:hypothetical protein